MIQTKTIKVLDRQGNYLSYCTPKRAHQLLRRNKATWTEARAVITLSQTPSEAKAVRAKVLQRDGYVCYLCDTELLANQVSYDHIHPRIRGGQDTVENMAVCCCPCNSEKGNRTPREFILLLHTRILLAQLGYRNDAFERRLDLKNVLESAAGIK